MRFGLGDGQPKTLDQIGDTFGTYTQGNLTALYGSVVAVLGANQFQFIGSGNNFVAQQSGALSLGYFDSNNFDNSGQITFNILGVPEPATWALMIMGFGMVGGAMRRRTTSRVALA